MLEKISDGKKFMEWYRQKVLEHIAEEAEALAAFARKRVRPDKEAHFERILDETKGRMGIPDGEMGPPEGGVPDENNRGTGSEGKPSEVFPVNERPSDKYDTEAAVVLSFDLAKPFTQEERVYRVKYDEMRLSESQREIVETYADRLRSLGLDVKVQPFSSDKSAQKSLISVYAAGKDFQGEGHVDVAVPEGNVEEYVLSITGMMNIALASANIPENATEEDLRTTYGPLVGFIRAQYKAILGSELSLPDSAAGLIQAIRWITLNLPPSSRIPVHMIEEYNRLAREALIRA